MRFLLLKEADFVLEPQQPRAGFTCGPPSVLGAVGRIYQASVLHCIVRCHRVFHILNAFHVDYPKACAAAEGFQGCAVIHLY